jgi:hypothetical protein
MPNTEPSSRKTVTLPDSLWQEIARVQELGRFAVETGAVRFLVERGAVPWPIHVRTVFDRLVDVPDRLASCMSSMSLEQKLTVSGAINDVMAALQALEPLSRQASSFLFDNSPTQAHNDQP